MTADHDRTDPVPTPPDDDLAIVDGHNDLAWALRQLNRYDLEAYPVDVRQSRTRTDLVRLAEGGVGAQFWSVYVPFWTGAGAVTATLEQIDFVLRMVAHYPYVPIADRLRSGIAVTTYDGRLLFGVTTDRDSMPDAQVLVDGITAGFAELAARAGMRPRRSPRRKKGAR